MTDMKRPKSVTVSSDIEALRRSPRELALDVLIAHELASGSPAAKLIWRSDWPFPRELRVTFQAKRIGDRRTTDVEARDDGRRLLCEDKLAGGGFQKGQIEGYVKEIGLDPTNIAAVVIAPRRFPPAEQLPEPLRHIAIEDLADVLARSAGQLESNLPAAADELARSYRHRADELRHLCAVAQPEPSELHRDFDAATTNKQRRSLRGAYY
jgi:hypothetical protein